MCAAATAAAARGQLSGHYLDLIVSRPCGACGDGDGWRWQLGLGLGVGDNMYDNWHLVVGIGSSYVLMSTILRYLVWGLGSFVDSRGWYRPDPVGIGSGFSGRY